MVRPTPSWAAIGFVAGLLLLSIGAPTALAADGQAQADARASAEAETDSDVVELGSHDVRIEDATVHVEDVHVTADGVPDRSVDEAAFTLDGETTIDGATVTVDGQTYQIGRVTLTFDEVGVTVEDVSIGDGNA